MLKAPNVGVSSISFLVYRGAVPVGTYDFP
jgi:hypothetical protein